jgi:hypothetical protein
LLKQMDVTNPRGMTLALETVENDSGFQIAAIDGLDPVKATLVSSSFATLDGEQFQSAKRGRRDLKILLDLEPDFDVDDYNSLRKKLNTYFRPKGTVDLRFYDTSGLYVDIEGVVEEVSSSMFDIEPKVQISVTCFQPDFIDPRMVTLTGSSTSGSTPTNIDYPGTVETGTVLTVHVNRVLSSFTIYNLREDGVLGQLDFSGSLIAGDELVISSIKGSKGITLTRAGVSSSYLYGRSVQSAWIELSEGINQFRVYSSGAAVPYTLEYRVRYGGF